MDNKELLQMFLRTFDENEKVRAQLTLLIREHCLPSNLNVPSLVYSRPSSYRSASGLNASGLLHAIKELGNQTGDVLRRIRMGQRSILRSRRLSEQKCTYDAESAYVDTLEIAKEHMHLYDMTAEYLRNEIDLDNARLTKGESDA